MPFTPNHTPPGLEVDENGRRTGFKIYIRQRQPMSPSGWLRWGLRQRTHIAKSRYVWKYYSSSKGIGMNNGIPIAVMRDDKTMAEYIIPTFLLTEGTYCIHGFMNGKTKSHIKLTKMLALLTVHDSEKPSYTVSRTGSLGRFWFRRKDKNRTQRSEFG